MRSSKVNAGDTGFASQYNNLRDDAKAASALLAHQQDTPDMTLKIEPGVVYFNERQVIYAGGNTPTMAAPSSDPRIDLVTIDKSGTIAIITGTEAASPAAPAYPSDKIVICEVFHRVGETALYDLDTAGEGYILRDTRAFVVFPRRRRMSVALGFEDPARYEDTVSGGAITFGDGSTTGVVAFNSGTGATNYANLRANLFGTGDFADFFDRDPELAALAIVPSIPASNTKDAYIVCGNLSIDFSELTRKHFGFIIRDNNGTGELHATWGNGAVQTTQQITGVTVTGFHLLYAKLVSGNRIEFWVDGVLKYTASANLPSGSLLAGSNTIFTAGVISSAGTSVYELYLANCEVAFDVGPT